MYSEGWAMLDKRLQQMVGQAMAAGPAILMPGDVRVQRPIDVVEAPTLSAQDKRAILAAWASDFYAIESEPALRRIPGTPEPVSIDDVQSALKELDRRYDL